MPTSARWRRSCGRTSCWKCPRWPRGSPAGRLRPVSWPRTSSSRPGGSGWWQPPPTASPRSPYTGAARTASSGRTVCRYWRSPPRGSHGSSSSSMRSCSGRSGCRQCWRTVHGLAALGLAALGLAASGLTALPADRGMLVRAIGYALAEALGTGIVSCGVAKAAVRDQDLVPGLSEGAGTLLCACAVAGTEDRRVAVGDRELTASLVIMTGAIEIAVHGWDISVACAGHGTIPAGLARDLLPIAPLLVTPATRAGRFADPVPVPALAAPGDRLVAFLGRQPAAAANPPGLPGLPP